MREAEKRKQIIERLSDNVFVEAGAGAGKTTLIVSRIVNQLKQGMDPGTIVVITFTNAAAEELRSRITDKVRMACKDDNLSLQEREYLKAALLQLDSMNISTIHSFCYKLLQEKIFEARLPMDIQLLEEDEAKEQYSNFFTQWSSNLGQADWCKLSECGDSKYVIINRIKSFFMEICELPDDTMIQYDPSLLQINYQSEGKKLVEEFKQIFCEAAAKLMGVGNIKADDIPDGMLRSAGKEIKKLLLQKQTPFFSVLELVNEEFKGKTTKYFNVKKKELPVNVSLEEEDLRCRAWSEQVNRTYLAKLLSDYQDYRYTLLLDYAMQARAAYRTKRILRNVTNDDLLQKTHQLICENKEAQKYFARKIQCLYVDEFQDTDHIQEEFIWYLAAKPDEPAKLRDGALFLVGDPKQSIYRFRGAEPDVYFAAKCKMEQLDNAKVYCLDNNYRSNEKIISWVNDAFRNRKLTSKGEYRDMVARKLTDPNSESNTLAGVYYYKNPEGKNVKHDEDAQQLTEIILKLVNSDWKITDYNEFGEPYTRKIVYSDFLVLCNTKKNMDLYLKTMSENGIPVQINGEISHMNHYAISRFVRFFDYLTHRYDRAKEVSALEVLREDGFQNAKETLEQLCADVKGMAIYAVANYLTHRLDILLPKGVDIHEGQMISVQTKLEQMLEQILAEDIANTDSLAERFWKYQQTSLDRELALEENGSSVRFMNLHKSKGLEGNIVILTKRDETMKFHEGVFRKGKKFYPALANSYGGTLWSVYRKDSGVLSMAETEENEEQTRLQYVAATRAKQVLILMDSISDSCMFTGYQLVSATDVTSIAKILEDTEIPKATMEKVSDYVMPVFEKGSDVGMSYYTYCPSDFEKGSQTRKTARARKEKMNLSTSERPKGNILGTVMHRSLQLLVDRWNVDFIQEATKQEKIILASINQAIMESYGEIEKEKIISYKNFLLKVLNCFTSWVCSEGILDDVKAIHTELPFSFYEENMQIEDQKIPVWMNGNADLIIEKKDGSFLVLDYKSDHDEYMTEDEFVISLKEKYSGQLQMYKYAVSRLFQVKEENIRPGIVSFTGTEPMKVRYTKME